MGSWLPGLEPKHIDFAIQITYLATYPCFGPCRRWSVADVDRSPAAPAAAVPDPPLPAAPAPASSPARTPRVTPGSKTWAEMTPAQRHDQLRRPQSPRGRPFAGADQREAAARSCCRRASRQGAISRGGTDQRGEVQGREIRGLRRRDRRHDGPPGARRFAQGNHPTHARCL